MARTVTELLSEQPMSDLLAMQESIRDELARLEFESRQVERALATRREPAAVERAQASAEPTATNGAELATSVLARGNGEPGTIKRKDVYDVVRALNKPVTTAMLRKLLKQHGYYATSSSVRNHLKRLTVQDKLLVVVGEGKYALPDDLQRPKETTNADREPEGSLSST